MLAIVTTHPVQYYAPVFQLLHQRGKIPVKVFYTWGEDSVTKHDPGFNRAISWDIPLLEGYPYEFVKNTAAQPGSHHFKGIINPDLVKRIEQLKPDAVLFFGWAYQSHLKAIRYFKNKIPVYFRGDSTLLDENKGLKAMLRALFLTWVYHQVNHAFYTGTQNKAYFKKFGLQQSQLTFAPHAVDNQRFAELRSAEAQALRNRLGIHPEAVVILFAGKFEEKKDPLLLLEAFTQLNQSHCHLLLVGNGPLEASLKQQAQTCRNVHFMDFQNQSYMPVIYQACDLFCLPSRGPGETWGLAVNEAMAAGKAVLVADKVGCAVDLVEEGYNGRVFKSRNLNELTEALQILTSSKSQLLSYGCRSQQKISIWSFEAIAQAIENTLTPC